MLSKLFLFNIIDKKRYFFRPIQDDHILEWHKILGSVVRWNKGK